MARNGEMNENLLEIHNLTKHYSGVKALDDVSLTVRQGEMHAICGENGADQDSDRRGASDERPFYL
jgi:putative multiple sugar transport system ATP-binding protein